MFSIKQISRQFCDNCKQKPTNDNSKKRLIALSKYISQKYITVIGVYERFLEKRFPRTYKIYRVFTVGAKGLISDGFQYNNISRQLIFSGKMLSDFDYNQLMVYFSSPKDLARVAPVVLVSFLPFTNYIVLPLAYLMPKQLLSHHFWTAEQKLTFQAMDHKKRLSYYMPVFRYLQERLPVITTEDNLQEKCRLLFSHLESGSHPSVGHVLGIRQLFVGKPFGIEFLESKHLTNLCRMHGLNAFPLAKTRRLLNHISVIHELDMALERNGFQSLSLEQIQKACFMRGLNPIDMSKEEMVLWLQQWIEIAKNIESCK